MFSIDSLTEKVYSDSELANVFVNIILLKDVEFQNVAATYESALCINQWGLYYWDSTVSIFSFNFDL